MPTFTPQQRLDITRRQLNIIQENAAYSSTQGSLNSEKAKLLSVDDANKVFYDVQRIRSDAYETESRQMNGSIPATYTDGTISPYVAGDLSTSAKTPGADAATFYPNSPIYTGFIPKVTDAVNGINHPTGTDSRYEQNILTNTTVASGLTQMIFRLSNGITGGTSGTSTTSTAIPAGAISALSVSVASTTNFAANELVYINSGVSSGIYKIISKTVTAVTIDSVIPSLTGISSSASIRNTVVAFTATERQTLVSSLYQEILTNITNGIDSLITEWEGKIDSQITQLGLNNETRSPQTTQNAAALSDLSNTKSIIDTWQARSSTGVSGKYVSASISPISSEITARQAFMTGRITEIVTALGSVSQSGDTYSGVTGSPYFERYKWLNVRINKASGSARRYFAADDGQAFLGMLASDNTAVKNEYDAYFLTKAITFVDETTIVQVTDTTGLSVGNQITVVSETQGEIVRAIMAVMGTTQLKLDKPIPNSYLVGDQARIFKTL